MSQKKFLDDLGLHLTGNGLCFQAFINDVK